MFTYMYITVYMYMYIQLAEVTTEATATKDQLEPLKGGH